MDDGQYMMYIMNESMTHYFRSDLPTALVIPLTISGFIMKTSLAFITVTTSSPFAQLTRQWLASHRSRGSTDDTVFETKATTVYA